MPNADTHDKITWSLAFAMAPFTWNVCHQLDAALLAAIGVLAGGLLLSPDLDCRSRPRKRWGIFAPLWYPLGWLGHRSRWSHGLVLGFAVRLALPLAALAALWWLLPDTVRPVIPLPPRGLALAWVCGLWIGGAAHTAADFAWPKRKRNKRNPRR